MHKRTLFAVLAAAAVSAVVTPSVSQAQQPTPQTSKGEVAMQPSVASLISAVDSASARNAKLKAMTDLTAANVQLVDVESLVKGDDADSLKSLLQKNDADITALRTTIGSNSTITSALTSNTVPLTANDVVAADVTPDGKVVVYYWKKSQ